MDELTSRLRVLYSAVLSDVLDDLGIRDRAMRPYLQPLTATRRMVGRAATLKVVSVDDVPAQPYKVQFAAIDALQPGQILLVEAPDVPSAFWGELITTRALARGCVGVVVDGYSRDVARIRRHDFGVWARGTHPADSLGRLDGEAFDVAISCGEVDVIPGDYIVADEDGVVAIPPDVIDEVLRRAEAKSATEDEVRSVLAAGESVATAYARFKVM